MDNEDLIERLKNQDIMALHEFIDRYGRLVYGVINTGLIQSNEKALRDECFDDILLDVWYNIKSYDTNKGKFTNWLISVCKFNVIDCKRKLGKSYKDCNIDSIILEDELNIENDIISNEEKNNIKSSIDKLDKLDREIFLRRYFEQESIDVIAAALHISRESVYNKLSRGRKKLKKIVMEGYYGE